MNDLLKPNWRIPAAALIGGLLISPMAPALGVPLAIVGALMFLGAGVVMALYGLVTAVEWLVLTPWRWLLRPGGRTPATR